MDINTIMFIHLYFYILIYFCIIGVCNTKTTPKSLESTIDLENFSVKKLRKAHTYFYEIKTHEFFYYDKFTFK